MSSTQKPTCGGTNSEGKGDLMLEDMKKLKRQKGCFENNKFEGYVI